MAYHNHFVLNSLGGNPKSAMPLPMSLTESPRAAERSPSHAGDSVAASAAFGTGER
jgi:hypothetical protein